jgi:transposase
MGKRGQKIVPWADVCRMKLLIAEGRAQKDIAKLFGIGESTLSNIKHGLARKAPHVSELSDREYLLSNSKINPSTGCLEWVGSKDKDGYGKVGRVYASRRAHRLMWVVEYGPIPNRLFVCHHCDNSSCIEPSHLFLGTCKENLDDSKAKGRRPLGSRRINAKLKEADINTIRGLLKSGMSRDDIGKMFGVTKGPISKIASGKLWSHVKEVESGKL